MLYRLAESEARTRREGPQRFCAARTLLARRWRSGFYSLPSETASDSRNSARLDGALRAV